MNSSSSIAVGALWLATLASAPAAGAASPQVVTLTQVPCQFLESENGADRGFRSKRAADCEAVNARTSDERLAKAKVLRLRPGRTVFRVANRNVPYELGFWLRGDGVINRARLPSVSGGGLMIGKTRDYEVDLKPGEYVYSCPLNPTPDYRLVVEQ